MAVSGVMGTIVAKDRIVETGIKDVPTAGTAVQLSTTSSGVKTLMIKADPANTGQYIYIGLSTVSSTTGWKMDKADDWFAINVTDLSHIYVDVTTNGDNVVYMALI